MTRVRLPLPSDFSFDGVVRSHGWYDLPPFSYDRQNGILQTHLPLPSGGGRGVSPRLTSAPAATAGRVSRSERPAGRGEGEPTTTRSTSITFRVRGNRLEAESGSLNRHTLTAIARRVFSLDVDLDTFARSISGEPALARALANGRGRILRAPTLFEDAVKILLTTNCSWAATKGMVARLIAEAGAEGRAFPAPAAIAALSASRLKTKIRCGYRAESLARFARRISLGQLDLALWQRREAAAEEIREAILSEHGFGPYAAEGLLRILGRHDYLALDSWVRQEYRRRYPGPRRTTDRAIGRRYARYGVHRGLALWLDMTSHWHEEKEDVTL